MVGIREQERPCDRLTTLKVELNEHEWEEG